MTSYRSGGRALKRLANVMAFVVMLAVGLYLAHKAGWIESDTGRFVAIDGDSLRKGNSEYRLHAIDAPELHQRCRTAAGADYPCGREARNALSKLITGKVLDCRILETDRYHRMVSVCTSGGLVVNAEMVRRGWAVAYAKYGGDYVLEERQARDARRGIWQGQFTRPENWRAEQRDHIVKSGVAEAPQPD